VLEYTLTHFDLEKAIESVFHRVNLIEEFVLDDTDADDLIRPIRRFPEIL